MKKKITLLMLFIVVSINAQTWTNVGNAGFSAGDGISSKMVLDSNNVPYVAYSDGGNGNKTTVMKFDGTNWVAVGNVGFSAGAAYGQVLVLDSNNVPYVTYRDDANGSKTTVMKFDGTNWITVGNTGFSAGTTYYQSMVLDSNNNPYVAYKDVSNGNKATVMKFDGTNWVVVGNVGFSTGTADHISMALDSNNVPYVGYNYGSIGSGVMKFNGSNWVFVGGFNFTGGIAHNHSLIIDSNDIPYIGYKDFTNSAKTTVRKFDGTNWVTVGSAGLSAGVANFQNLALDSNNLPYIAYRDDQNGSKTTVMKFDGANWVTVGSAGFSSGVAEFQTLVLDSYNVPYIGYRDFSNGNKITVKKFNPIQRTLTITAPANGSVVANTAPVNGTYNDGTALELTATPTSGYLFAGWSGDASGTSNPLSLTMDADKTVTATFTLIPTTTWTGGAGGAWDIAGNWTNGVPTNTTNAIIPTNNNNSPNPVVSTATAIVNNLEIQSSRPFTINSGSALTIEGNLTQSGTIIVNSSATANGSLILKGTTSGFVTYNRHTKTSDWHLMSSPVLSESISRFSGSGGYSTNGNNHGIATYDNTNVSPSSRYVYYTTAAGINNIASAGHFIAGKGYSIKTDNATIFPFTGYVNASDVSVSITDGSATGNKWNLVGNPFTSSINGNTNADAVNNFLTVNASELDPVRVAMYVWNGTSYDIINQATAGSQHIAVAQGFFVESKNGGGTIQLTKAMQSHQTGDNFQRTSNTVPSISLMISNGKSKKSTDIKYYKTATIGLDPGYDAGVFSGEEQAFNVYTQLLSNETTVGFGIQSLPTNNYEAMVIPLGVNAVENTTLSFTAAIENLPSGINVYIEDKVENTFTLLDTAQANYTATVTSAVNGFGRFYLHTTSSVLSVDTNIAALNSIHIYKSNTRTLTITGLANQEKNNVKVYTILGKQVFNKSIAAQQKAEVQLPMSLSTGVYLIKLQTANGSVNKKVILN